jgi:hypothetical protein
MNKDLECPYCGQWQEVNHDDGQGYAENELHQMECSNCGKNFVFTTYISFSYEPYKADCLNGKKHRFKAQNCYPRECVEMECEMCGETRKPTDKEMSIILAN